MSGFQIGNTASPAKILMSDRAAEWVERLLRDEDKPLERFALRLAVLGGGCSGFRYEMKWDEPGPDDVLVTHPSGSMACLDPKSFALLAGSTIDYVQGLQGAGFTIVNPNASSTCGCGESFSI